MKKYFQALGRRMALHWRSSLIGAIEGSGLVAGGSFLTDPKLSHGAYAMAAYLFVKGLLSQDPQK